MPAASLALSPVVLSGQPSPLGQVPLSSRTADLDPVRGHAPEEGRRQAGAGHLFIDGCVFCRIGFISVFLGFVQGDKLLPRKYELQTIAQAWGARGTVSPAPGSLPLRALRPRWRTAELEPSVYHVLDGDGSHTT